MSVKPPNTGSPPSAPHPDDIPTEPRAKMPKPTLDIEPTLSSTATIASGRFVRPDGPQGDHPEAPAPKAKAPRETFPPGTIFWDYQIQGVLGRGGMGTVYEATHLPLKRKVAVKILDRGETDPHESDVRRFMREARNTAALRHPNIVTVFDFGRVDGYHYIEMECIRGAPLTTLIRKGPLPPLQAALYVKDTARALSHAHSQGIYHRDIKPSNLLLEESGSIKVVDFGLSLAGEGRGDITKTGDLLGTFHYMAPELWQSLGTDARTDLYALGITFYQLLTGRLPFRGGIVGLMHQHTGSPVPDPREQVPDIPEEWHQIVQILTAKDPTLRFPSAGALVAALDRAIQEL